MNEKEVKFNEEAKEGLFEGITILAKAVMVTLGPNGRNVIYNDIYNGIDVTKDGVTVAERMKLDDTLQDMGCQLVKQAARKTNEQAGDGTTTSTLLAYHLIEKGLKLIEKIKCNPVEVKRGMDKALENIVTCLRKRSIPIDGDVEKIRNVATISGNNDPYIGDLLADAFKEIGDMNNVDIAETKTGKTFVSTVKGCQFNRGYLSDYFCNNVDAKQVEFDDPFIVVYEGKPSSAREIGIHVQNAGDKPIVFMLEDISNDILQSVITEKLRKKLKIAIVKTPGFGLNKEDRLLDICASIGAVLVTKKNKLSDVKQTFYGKAEKIVIDKKGTMIVNGGGSKEKVQKRVDTLTERLNNAKSVGERDALNNRIAKLGAGIAIINIGANTPVELSEKKARITDAVEATKAAIEEGILPGGGTAYIKVINDLSDIETLELSTDEKIGYTVVLETLYKPLQVILENGGEGDKYSHILSSLKSSDVFESGYNAKLGTYGNMYEQGVIDPAKVVRVALENAVSVAGMVLITECALVDINDETKDLPAYLQ